MKRLLTDNRFLAVVLLLLFIPIHLYALGELPFGMYVDEVGMAYDAWCLANYGVDRYLKPFPVYLTNYGGGQSAMYAWLAAGLIALTGSTSTAVLRLPGAAFGLMTMTFGALVVHEIMGKKHPKAWFVFGLFYLICPYFTMAARFGLDCNLMLGMSTAFLYAVLRAAKLGRMRDYALAGLSGALTLYTYAVSYIPVALFLLFSLVWLVRMRRFRWRNIAAAAVPFAVVAGPLIAMQVINLFDLNEVTLFGMFTLTKLPHYRTDELGFGNLLGGLIGAIRSALTHDVYAPNAPFQFWTMYPLSVPFAVIGAVTLLVRGVRSFRRREADPAFFALRWGVAMLCVGALFQKGWPAPNVNQMNGILFVTAASAVLGIFTALDWLRGNVRRAASAVVALAYAASAVLFFNWYFIERDESFQFSEIPAELLDVLEQTPEFDGRTVHIALIYPYYCFAEQISPYELDLAAQASEGEITYVTYENYRFVPADFLPPLDPDDLYVCTARDSDYNLYLRDDDRFQCVQIGEMLLYFDADLSVELPQADES